MDTHDNQGLTKHHLPACSPHKTFLKERIFQSGEYIVLRKVRSMSHRVQNYFPTGSQTCRPPVKLHPSAFSKSEAETTGHYRETESKTENP